MSASLCRSDCSGPCLLGDESTLSSPGRHFRPRDGGDVTGLAPAGYHDDACCVGKSLLTHDDATTCSGSTSTTGVRCAGSPHAHLIYDGRPAILASCNSVHAVVFSSTRDHDNSGAVPIACDCVRTDENDDDDASWRLAQSSSRSADDDVQYYVIDRRKLASAMRLTTSSAAKRTSPITDDVKQLKQLRTKGSRTENSAESLAVTSLVGECRPLLVVSPGECCKNQRYSPVPHASVDNSNDSTNS